MADRGDKTEKATPKKRQEARKKGSVAKSQDLNGAIVMFAALFALSATAPHLVEVLQTSMRDAFGLISSPDVVNHRGLGPLLSAQVRSAGLAAAPVILTCVAAGGALNVGPGGGTPPPPGRTAPPKPPQPP